MKEVSDEFYQSALKLAEHFQDDEEEWENFTDYVVIDRSVEREDHILHHAAIVGGFTDQLDEQFGEGEE